MKFLLCFCSSESNIHFLNWLANAAEVFEALLVQISTTKEKQSPLRVLNHLKENGNINVYRWGDTKFLYREPLALLKIPMCLQCLWKETRCWLLFFVYCSLAHYHLSVNHYMEQHSPSAPTCFTHHKKPPMLLKDAPGFRGSAGQQVGQKAPKQAN